VVSGVLAGPPFGDEPVVRYSSSADAPKPGDIILRRTRAASGRYTLRTAGEAPQVACKTYEEALAHAHRFAESQHVDAWQTDDDRIFRRITECRLVGSA
jgi:hypothetical protein